MKTKIEGDQIFKQQKKSLLFVSVLVLISTQK
jgi:hypothetical protein